MDKVIFGGIALVLIVFGYVIYVSFAAEAKDEEDFMVECMKDHKKYECTAMWRAGNTKTTVVPVVVPAR